MNDIPYEELTWIPLALAENPERWPICADFLEEKGLQQDAEGLRLADSLAFPMVWCPPGKFVMGSPEHEVGRCTDEDQVEVTLTRGFWIGKFQVTQEEYERIMGTNPSHFQDLAGHDTSRFPVDWIRWIDAIDFCVKLTQIERADSMLSTDWRYALPTEAQWEYACRAGTTTATAFGDRLDSTQANFDGGYPYNNAPKGPFLRRTTIVGSYAPNPWGIYDMHGNVWEWCLDSYQSRLPGGVDPCVILYAVDPVLRGGSWRTIGQYCRSAYRDMRPPSDWCGNKGFRVVLVPCAEITK